MSNLNNKHKHTHCYAMCEMIKHSYLALYWFIKYDWYEKKVSEEKWKSINQFIYVYVVWLNKRDLDE